MAIHPTAIIDPKAEVARTAEIGAYVIIEGHVKIGEHVRVYPHAYLAGWTEIEERCQIHPGAVVGHLPQDFHFGGERSYCKVGAGTIIREFASVHRGTQPESWTILGKDCFILGYAHIGHNCELADGVKVYNCAALSGHVTVGENAIISGYSLIHQFARIGEYVMLGGGARLTKDVPPYFKAMHESECVGINLFGLRRSEKFNADEIRDVKEAYKMLYKNRTPLTKAVALYASVARTRTGRRIIEFINATSKLGIIGGRRSRGQQAEGDDEE